MVKLQKAANRFEKRGLGVAAVTYDNAAILKEFADQYHISYSLLSDPNSDIIRTYGILDTDENPNNLPEFAKKGIALPGYFLIDPTGIIRDKYFGNIYYDRYTANNVLHKLFPELLESSGRPTAVSHLTFSTLQSDRDVILGSRVTLGVAATLTRGVHVYSANNEGYRQATLLIDKIDDSPVNPKLVKIASNSRPKILQPKAIKQRVPVYEGRFSLTIDLIVLPPRAVQQQLDAEDTKSETNVKITIHGRLVYQACDAKTCFPPQEAPVSWELRIHPLDLKRASDPIQDKRN